MRADVAAIFVRADGPYPGLVDDWYDRERDARSYSGGAPVVAHPPCARWGNYWYTDGSTKPGNDGGLFAFAVGKLRECGGVLEHPSGSRAWAAYGLPNPQRGWTRSLLEPNMWTCQIYQRNYGHRAEKRTWLAYVGDKPPFELDWSGPEPGAIEVENMGERERELTPPKLAAVLVELAAWAKNTDSQSKGQEEND